MINMKSDRQTVIKQRLTRALAPVSLKIIDDSERHAGHAGAESGAGHYSVTVVSSIFLGKSTVARHRMVYAALDGMIGPEIHAIQINAMTPEEARD